MGKKNFFIQKIKRKFLENLFKIIDIDKKVLYHNKNFLKGV